MFCRLCLSIILLFLSTSLSWGQVHTSTYGADFVHLSPSARANGMGMAGVALTDPYASFFNPGSLGLCDDFEIAYHTFSPRAARYADFKRNAYHRLSGDLTVVEIGDWTEKDTQRTTRCLLGFGRNVVGTSGWVRSEVAETWVAFSPYYPSKDMSDNITLSVGLFGYLDIGIGATFKRIRMYYWKDGSSSKIKWEDTHGFDYGVLIRKSYVAERFLSGHDLSIKPSLGLSWSNYGPGVYYYRPIDLPKIRRLGFAVDMELQDSGRANSLTLCSFVPAFEIETRLREEFSLYKVGVELGLYGAVFGRVGLVTYDNWLDSQPTWGFSVRSRGIARLLGWGPRDDRSGSDGWLVHLLRNRLQVGCTFARVLNDDYWSYLDRADYWAIEISL